jgi:hypothetical protein
MTFPFKVHYPFGQPPEGMDVLWRCEAKRYSYVIDADREEYGVTNPQLELTWWSVSRRTPKGAWLHDKFIRLTAFKRWACNTPQEAVDCFIARKKRQIAILSNQLQRAEGDLALTAPPLFKLARSA